MGLNKDVSRAAFVEKDLIFCMKLIFLMEEDGVKHFTVYAKCLLVYLMSLSRLIYVNEIGLGIKTCDILLENN